jgi:hypothetical protein
MLLREFRQPMPQKSFAVSQRSAASFAAKACLSSAVALAPAFLLPVFLALPVPAIAQQPATPVLLDTMTTELHRAFTSLGKQPSGKADGEPQPPYFLSYDVSDASYVGIRAQYGALVESTANRIRVADVQVRLGDPKLDNTHGTHRASAVNSMQLPLTDDREALGRSLWLATNTGYGTALDNYLRVKTESQVRAKEEDSSPDFSQQAPQTTSANQLRRSS